MLHDPCLVTTLELIEQGLKIIKKPLIAFSGGKDSLALAHIASRYFDIKDAVMETSFAFPLHLFESRANAEQYGISLIERESFDRAWLRLHPEYFLPYQKGRQKYWAISHQKAIQSVALEMGFDGALMGRRTQTNTVPAALYLKRGIWPNPPLKHWKSNDVFKYLAKEEIVLPSIYRQAFSFGESECTWNAPDLERLNQLGLNYFELAQEFDPSVAQFFEVQNEKKP